MISMTLPQYRRRECTIDGRLVRLCYHSSPRGRLTTSFDQYRHATELLAVLLVSSPDRFVSTSTLVEAIWPNPDFEPSYAKCLTERLIGFLRRQGVTIETCYTFGYRIPRYAREPLAMQEAA